MDLDSLFQCKLTHICRVQMVITLYPKPDKMPQVLSLMMFGKFLAKKTVNALQIWAQTVKTKVVSKGHLYFCFSLPFPLLLFFGENLIEHIDISIAKKAEATM